jgi:prevent-host-death family protein
MDVGIFEAKAKLSELVARAERGQETTITRNRKAVARLVPILHQSRQNPNAEVIDKIIAFSRTLKLRGQVDLRELIATSRE